MKILQYEDELYRRELINKIKYIEDALRLTILYKNHCMSPSIIRLYESQILFCEKKLDEAKKELQAYE